MKFNRQDIQEAYYIYYCFWHSGITQRDYLKSKRTGYREAITVQLHRIGFKAHKYLDLETLSENALEIYKALVIKYEGQEAYRYSLKGF